MVLHKLNLALLLTPLNKSHLMRVVLVGMTVVIVAINLAVAVYSPVHFCFFLQPQSI